MSDDFHQASQFNWKPALITLALIVGFYILREHYVHVVGLLPYLLLLACPLMHMFGPGGHGVHHHHDEQAGRAEDKK